MLADLASRDSALRNEQPWLMSTQAIAVSGATVGHMERELNGELERRGRDVEVLKVSHAVTSSATTSTGQIYSVVVLFRSP